MKNGIIYLLIIIGFFAIMLAGCGSFKLDKEITPTVETVVTTSVPVQTPTAANWVVDPDSGHSYLVVYEGRVWPAAQKYCQELSANLVSITSQAENDFVYNLVYQDNIYGEIFFWIGFTDEQVEGTWVWISGDPVTYTDWGGGEPDNSANGCGEPGFFEEEDFTFMSENDHWQDGGIAETFFICERNST